jgi:WD40 repeat protein
MEFLMSDPLPADTRHLAAHIAGACFDAAGNAGFALGDGNLVIAPADGGEWERHTLSTGAILSIAAAPRGFLTGGDDGRLLLTRPGGVPEELVKIPRKWIEHVAAWGDAKSGLMAASCGKIVMLFGADGIKRHELTHPATVNGIAFDAKGKRLAASHYNGASVWFTQAATPTPRLLEWKGSHLSIAMQPGAEAVVTAMQETSLHGWRLSDGQHMRMTGYPTKTASLDFSHNGRWLASSGADAVVLWPFFGGGPMGKPPRELGLVENMLVTRVACHPANDIIAAGYADGSIRLLDINGSRELELVHAQATPISALSWGAKGRKLCFGTENGTAGVLGL